MKEINFTNAIEVNELVIDTWNNKGIIVFYPNKMDLVVGYTGKEISENVLEALSCLRYSKIIDTKGFEHLVEYLAYILDFYSDNMLQLNDVDIERTTDEEKLYYNYVDLYNSILNILKKEKIIC